MLEEIFQRWELAFNEINLPESYKTAAVTFKYTTGYGFDIEDYDDAKLISRSPLTDHHENDRHYTLYGFREDGLPCYFSNSMFEGFFSYSADCVESIEFNINTHVPSKIKRILFKDGKKIALDALAINGGASMLHGMSIAGTIERVKNNPHNFFARAERYGYINGRIEKAICERSYAGMTRSTFEKKYYYDANDVLDEIKVFDSTTYISYVRLPDNYDKETILENLAQGLAKTVVEKLVTEKIDLPLATVELNYRYADNYFPIIATKSKHFKDTVVKNGSNIASEMFCSMSNLIEIEIGEIERAFVQFEQIMKKTDDHNLGAKMLRRVACILTQSKLLDKIPVSEEFIAYAIDHSIEGHEDEDLHEILLECGLAQKTLQSWIDNGWFDIEKPF